MELRSVEAKLGALRAKTDLDLFRVMSRELEAALAAAGSDPAKARRVHDNAVLLLPGLCALSQDQRCALRRRISALAGRLGTARGPEAGRPLRSSSAGAHCTP